MSEDIVTRFKNLLAEYTDAPEELKEIAALTAISTLVGKRAVIPYEPKAKIFTALSNGGLTASGMFLNIFSFVIGESRITRKSTTMKFMEDLIKNINEDLLITQSFTPEALLEELNEKQGNDYAQVLWIVEEAAQFYEACRKKDYMGEAQSLIQQLYDGSTFSRRTKGGGRIRINNPYFVAFLISTPFVIEEKLITPSDFHHGFLNRFLLIRVHPTMKRKDIEFTTKKIEENTEARGIFEWFKGLWELTDIKIVSPNFEVIEKFNNFDEKIKEEIFKEKDPTTQSYIGNFPEFLLKLMGLYRIAREKTFSEPTLVLEEEDYNRANKFLNLVKNSFFEVKNTIMKKAKTRKYTPTDTADWEDLVAEVIEGYGRKIDRSTLLQKVQKYGINAKALDEIIGELQQKDKVSIRIESPPGSGRKRIVYELKESQ